MSDLDHWLKGVLADETPTITHYAVVFEVPPEIRTTELRPDGLLRTSTPASLGTLPAPWSLLRHEAVFEGKMPGDKLGPDVLQRTCFRREARQAQRFAEAAKDKRELDPDPNDCAAWMLAPHVAQWLRAWEQAGRLTLAPAGDGCWWVRPAMFPVLWIAANELPLREELIPFLTARTGRKLEEFVAWVVSRRSPAWIATMVQSLPEVSKMIRAVEPKMSPEEFAEVIAAFEGSQIGKTLIGRGRTEGHSEGRSEGRTEGRAEALRTVERQFARRLGRQITTAEHAELLRRLDTLGPDRIGDVVLDLAPDALAAWLADPDAR
ncbi:MAG: hypothetical protein U0324_14025, partial [Polyangiales bacterium]